MTAHAAPAPATPRPERVQLLVTCLVDSFFPRVGLSTVAVLERLGLEVVFRPDQTCCGQPAFNGGFADAARDMARHTLDVLSADPAPIVVPSGSCADMVIHQYAGLFAGEPVYGGKAAAVAARTFELSQFLVDVLGVTDVGARGAGSVAYHACCHGLRGLGVDRQPRCLVGAVGGVTTVPLVEAEACCGFGGLFSVKMPDVSGAILRRKLDHIEASGADVIVGTDVSCLMHIAGGLRRRDSTVRVKHLAELLDERTS